MNFAFDIDKATAATGYLLKKSGGSHTVLFLVKMLYAANRMAIVANGRSITGDRFVSMDNGPVVSQTYGLMNGDANPSAVARWNEFISEREGNTIRLKRDPGVDALSKAEIAFLDEARELVQQAPPGRLAEWSHKKFPEWKDPSGSSFPIDPADILKIEKFTPDQIAAIEDDIAAVDALDRLLASR